MRSSSSTTSWSGARLGATGAASSAAGAADAGPDSLFPHATPAIATDNAHITRCVFDADHVLHRPRQRAQQAAQKHVAIEIELQFATF
jgi:hypothetical protein